MSRSSVYGLLGGGLAMAFLAAAGIARAAEPKQDPPAEQKTLELVVGERLSGPQRVEKLEEYHRILAGYVQDVLILLEYAREKKEAVRIVCLNDKLEQMLPHVKAVAAVHTRLLTDRKLPDAQNLALYNTVLPRLEAVLQLRGQAAACVGELARHLRSDQPLGVKEVESPYYDPASLAEPVQIDSRPQPASPYQLQQLP